jgi:hypothetical protein
VARLARLVRAVLILILPTRIYLLFGFLLAGLPCFFL